MSSEYQKGPEKDTEVPNGRGEETGSELNELMCKRCASQPVVVTTDEEIRGP